MKVLIVIDAWHPQVNGVVHTLGKAADGLRTLGHNVEMITPERFKTMPCPTCPEIRILSFFWAIKLQRLSATLNPIISTSLQKARWAWPHAVLPADIILPLRQPITHVFLNIFICVFGCRYYGHMATSDGFTDPQKPL